MRKCVYICECVCDMMLEIREDHAFANGMTATEATTASAGSSRVDSVVGGDQQTRGDCDGFEDFPPSQVGTLCLSMSLGHTDFIYIYKYIHISKYIDLGICMFIYIYILTYIDIYVHKCMYK